MCIHAGGSGTCVSSFRVSRFSAAGISGCKVASVSESNALERGTS